MRRFYGKNVREFEMKKRLLSLFIAFSMLCGMLPTGIFARPVVAEEELYMQMLALGLSDENGQLIEDNTFTLEDGTTLASLAELEDWLAFCPEEEWDTIVTVDRTGKQATAEEIANALSLEYRMADLASQLDLLASGALNDTTAEANATVTPGHKVAGLRITYETRTYNEHEILDINVILLDGSGNEISAPCDIKMEAGLFCEVHRFDLVSDPNVNNPARNRFSEFSMAAGESKIIFSVDISSIRAVMSGLTGSGPVLWDGAEDFVFMCRITDGATPCARQAVFGITDSDTQSPILRLVREGGKVATNRVVHSGDSMSTERDAYVATLNADDQYHTYTEVTESDGYLSFTIPEVADAASDTAWEKLLNQAVYYGVGDKQPMLQLTDVSIVGEEGSLRGRLSDWRPRLYYVEDGKRYQMDIAYESYNIVAESMLTNYPAYGQALAAAYCSQDTYNASGSVTIGGKTITAETFYNQLVNDSQIYRFTKINVPFTRGSRIDRPIVLNTNWQLNETVLSEESTKDALQYLICTGTYKLLDSTAPTIKAIHITGDGETTYYPGDRIPITVEFSEPVRGDYKLICASGDGTMQLASLTDARYATIGSVKRNAEKISNMRTFMYEVQGADSTQIEVLGVTTWAGSTCEDVCGNAFANSTGLAYQEFRATLAEGQIVSTRPQDGITAITAAIDENDLTKAIVTVEINNTTAFQNMWADLDSDTMQIVLDGDTSVKYPLELREEGTGDNKTLSFYAEIPLTALYGDTTVDHTAELYINAALYYGKYATFTQKGIIKADESAYTLSVDRWYSGVDGTIFLGDGTMPQFTATKNPSAQYTYTSDDQFYWVSSNPAVLAIHSSNSSGTLVNNHTVTVDLVAEGTAKIYLMAKNGTEDTAQHTVASGAIKVTVKAGNRPILSIPQNANTFIAQNGEAQVIRFVSNLDDYAPLDENITAKLYQGNTASGAPIWQTELERGGGSVTIPAGILDTISAGSTPSYTLTLSATAIVDSQTISMETTAYILVRAKAAVVTLIGLTDTQFTAHETIPLTWKVENFDIETNKDAAFSFRIEKDGKEIYSTAEVGEKTAELTFTGSYTLQPETPAFKETYIVTVRAKNSADPTWSTDSATITVYNSDALRLLVGGEDVDSVTLANRVAESATSTSPTVTSYAGKTIDGLTDAYAIAGLRSELSLIDTISVDTTGADWSILDDRIRWETSTGSGREIVDELNRAVTVNYKRGSLYEPLERFTYTAYLPQIVMLLSGIRSGTNIVTATHNGVDSLTDSVQVNVERLRDQLYLFQFTPAVETTLHYTDKTGAAHTVTSNADGSLALYEPNGIASDLQTASMQSGVAYRGTFAQSSLKSGEGDGAIGELYPMNALSLRLAATAEITLLRPDGTPYANADVFLRGGVYRNSIYAENRDDAYCADAMFAKSEGETASLDGKTTQTYHTDANGVLRVHMDIAQFTTENDPDPVGVGDMLAFVFEVQFAGDTYQPEIITVNGSLNTRDAMRSGENIVTLRAAEGVKPFITAQKIDYHTGRQISVRDHTGVVGPSANYPEVLLETTVMLWGTDDLTDVQTQLTLRAQETAVAVPEQEKRTVRDSSYPFSSIPLVTNVSTLNADTFAAYTAHQKTSMEAVLYRADGSLWQTIPLPFGLVDMNAIEKVEDSPSLLSLMTNLAIYGRVGGADTKYDLVNEGSDFMFNDALSFLADMGGEAGLVRAILMPTEDPTRFSGYFWTGINTTKLEDLSYDEHGISVEPNYMWQDLDSCIGQVNDTFTVSDFQAMADGSYFDDRSNLYGAVSSAIGLPIMLVLEGFLETEIRYNFDKGQWEVLTTGGGFTAGGQLEYEKTFNIEPFGIPIFTVSIKVRGGATVDFKTAVRYAEQLGLEWDDDTARAVNDYLTALRINAYFEFFGGVGHDKGYTAKIGVFGTIGINNDNWFLTRKYLKNTEERDLKGQYLQLNGEAGIRAALGLGPVVTEITVVSLAFQNQWRFNSFEGIKKYWDEAESGLGSTGYDYSTETESYTLSAVPTYTVVQEDDRVTITDYSVYLQNDANSTWVGGTNNGRRGIRRAEGFVVDMFSTLVKGALPLANPYLNDDGSMALHLWGTGSTNKVYYSESYNTDYGKELPDGGFSGYGDSALSVDGTADFTGAIWLRESATLDLAPGSALTTEEQTTLLNGLEVTASLWNGSKWQITRLTENGTAEISPVIAVNENGQAIAAWRTVQTGENLFSFDSDRIAYRIYDGETWSAETYTLYNGSSGGVTALSAKLLDDGTAAIAYSLDDGEVYYALVYTASSEPEDDTRVIRATTNDYADDSPMLTKTVIEDDEVFVLGWRSVQNVADTENGGGETADICLRVFDKTGAPRNDFPESLANAVDMTAFDGKFTFAGGINDIATLSILWNDAGAGKADNDVIRAVKICKFGNTYALSAPLTVREMPEKTVVDHMDAFSNDGKTIGTLILATTFGTDEETIAYSYTYTDENGEKHTYTGEGAFPSEESSIYYSVTPLSNQISVDALTVDYTTLAKNAYVPVNMTVTNDGYDVIRSLTVQIDGAAEQSFAGLNLLPGKSTTISVIAQTGDTIRDMDYRVTASYESKGTVEETGTLYLDYPDVGISRLQVTSEQERNRTLLATLYNQSPVAIDNGSRRVVLGVYSDPECTSALDGKYFVDGTNGQAYTVAISDADSLAAIDNGGYAHEIRFDIGTYIRDAGLTEIPSAGVTLFVAARLEKQNGSKWLTMPEADVLNNQKNLTLESLLTRHDNLPVTTTVETAVTEGATTATVTLRNNSLKERPAGVLIVSLLSADGRVLETYRYDVDGLAGEEIVKRDVPFTQNGDRVIARYSEVITDETQSDNADAAVISIDGLPLTLADFDANDRATLEASSGQYLLTVIPAHKDATVTIDGVPAENGTASVRVPIGGTTVTVTITAADGVTTRTYTISLTNDERWINPLPDAADMDFCRVTFRTNGGTSIASVSRLAGTWLSLSGYTPTREGYLFDGWYLDAALTMPVTELRMTKDVTLYAGWRQIGTTETPAEGIPFVDVTADDWFYSDVLFVYEKSLMNGTSANRFTPYGTATRAMMATVLWRMAGSPTTAKAAPYADVAEDAWYAEAVAWTTANGIFNGYGDGTFQPDTPVTREQLAAIFHRYAAFTGSDSNTRGDLAPYADGDSVSDWAVDSIRWAIGTGLLRGKGENRLDPTGQATRAEIAAILHRFIGE